MLMWKYNLWINLYPKRYFDGINLLYLLFIANFKGKKKTEEEYNEIVDLNEWKLDCLYYEKMR